LIPGSSQIRYHCSNPPEGIPESFGHGSWRLVCDSDQAISKNMAINGVLFVVPKLPAFFFLVEYTICPFRDPVL
jgi:hypothetical protein